MKKRQIMVSAAFVMLTFTPMMVQKAGGRTAKGSKPNCQQMIQHPWQGKRVAYFGDSITDPNNMPSATLYWGFLQQWLGITPWVYGVSGREWSDIPRQADQLKADHGDYVDAILIFCGTNDFNNSVPVGDWYYETEDSVMSAVGRPAAKVLRRHRHFSMNPDTYRGRINIALSKLKQMYPTKQIVLLTPLHRAYFYYSNTNIQPDEMFANGAGLYVDSYVQSIREASAIWSVPVIDLNAQSGLFPLADGCAQFFHNADTDRLHPNEAGHARIARLLMYQLATLPCTF